MIGERFLTSSQPEGLLPEAGGATLILVITMRWQDERANCMSNDGKELYPDIQDILNGRDVEICPPLFYHLSDGKSITS
jgi:hypothetical protein